MKFKAYAAKSKQAVVIHCDVDPVELRKNIAIAIGNKLRVTFAITAETRTGDEFDGVHPSEEKLNRYYQALMSIDPTGGVEIETVHHGEYIEVVKTDPFTVTEILELDD